MFVPIIGNGSGGTSMLAGICHHLGVPMYPTGTEPHKRNKARDYLRFECTTYEHKVLNHHWAWCRKQPHNWDQAEAQKRITAYAKKFRSDQPLWGVKGGMSLWFIQDWKEEIVCKPILVQRNISDVLASYKRHKEPAGPLFACMLHGMVDNFAETQPCLALRFEVVQRDPHLAIASIVGYLGLNPSQKQIESALSFVKMDEPEQSLQSVSVMNC